MLYVTKVHPTLQSDMEIDRLIFFNAAFIKVDIEVIDITVFSLSHLLFFVCYDKMVVRAKKT
ncbi:hypothetical protein V6Z11_D05G206200 [Gossypium hirsutum]